MLLEYIKILDEVRKALDDEEEESYLYGALHYLTELMEYDIEQPSRRLVSLMQGTVQEMESEYRINIGLYPEFKSFLSRIKALYS